MDPDSDSEDLREDGTLLPSASAASHEPKHPRGQSPMGRRRRRGISRLAVMMSILGISALMIVGFAMLKFTAQVRVPAPPPKEPPAEPPAESAVPDPAESEASPPPPELKPVADPFNLRTTGFVVSDKPQTREFVFNITRGRSSPDGVSKDMILVNGQSPGPLIQANKGDKLQITVHNSMPKERTSIHWHGIDQKNSVFMDGVYRVTECGIPSGESFTYVFDVVDQRGSFWYHGHVSAQYTDGLFGPLIIHDPDEKIPPVEEDRVIMIGDHYHVDAEEALSIYTGTTTDGGREPRPDNILINGRNTYDCSPASSNRARQEDPTRHVPAGCSTGSIYSARVPSKRRVRLRLISHSSNIPLWFTVDSHVLEIVEIDGVEVEPIKTTRVFLNAGQRYSVVFTTDQPAGNYLMRAIALKGCAMLGGSFGSHLAKVNYEATGILSYDNVDVNDRLVGKAWDMRAESLPDSTSEPWTQKCRDLPFDLPKPVRAMKAYEAGERNKHQAVFSQGNHNGAYRSFVNSVVFSPLNDSATVWQTSRQNLSLANLESSTPKWDFGADQNILVSRDDDKAAQIAISANQMMSHPWHLHGQNFQIVGWGKGLFGMGETTWNLDNPMRRDTVLVGSHSHVVIRYVATNPGVWALHCHIQWHAEGGMFATTAQRLAELNTLIDSLDSDKGAGLGRKFCKR